MPDSAAVIEDGGSLDPLVRASRDFPFLCRKAAMLNVLAGGIPEGDELLASLLRDPELGPVALLVQKRDRDPDEVSPEEAAWLMAGSILELLEIGGPDAVRAQLEELPRPQRVMCSAPCATPAIRHAERLRTSGSWSPSPILSAPPRLRTARNPSARDPRRPKRRGR